MFEEIRKCKGEIMKWLIVMIMLGTLFIVLFGCSGGFYEIKNMCKLCDRCEYPLEDSKDYWKKGNRLYQFCDGCIERTNIRNQKR